jgi:hypothetical protein
MVEGAEVGELGVRPPAATTGDVAAGGARPGARGGCWLQATVARLNTTPAGVGMNARRPRLPMKTVVSLANGTAEHQVDSNCPPDRVVQAYDLGRPVRTPRQCRAPPLESLWR